MSYFLRWGVTPLAAGALFLGSATAETRNSSVTGAAASATHQDLRLPIPLSAPIATSFDPAGAGLSPMLVLSDGNLTATNPTTSMSSASFVRSIKSVSRGIWRGQFRVKVSKGNDIFIGLADTTQAQSGLSNGPANVVAALGIFNDAAGTAYGPSFNSPGSIGDWRAIGSIVDLVLNRGTGQWWGRVKASGSSTWGNWNNNTTSNPTKRAGGFALPAGMTGATHFVATPNGAGSSVTLIPNSGLQSEGALDLVDAPTGFTYVGTETDYKAGSYDLYLAPFDYTSIAGTDASTSYWNRGTVDNANFPNNTVIEWKRPAAQSPNGIGSFYALDYGNYAYTDPLLHIPARQIKNITTLTSAFNWQQNSGDAAGYDTIFDYFLTSVGTGAVGDTAAGNRLFEIEVFLHLPPYSKAYADGVVQKGTYTDDQGRSWHVSVDQSGLPWQDVLIYPTTGQDITSGTFNHKHFLVWCTAQGIMTGNEWFNGLALGVEVGFGNGSVTVNSFSNTYN